MDISELWHMYERNPVKYRNDGYPAALFESVLPQLLGYMLSGVSF